MVSDLNVSQEKEPDFVSFPLLGFTLFIKLNNFDFGSHWKTLTFFDKKMMSDFIMPYQTVSDLV